MFIGVYLCKVSNRKDFAMVKVAAIMPVCNAAATLERVVHSLMVQTIQDVLIVIVDDGAVDYT